VRPLDTKDNGGHGPGRHIDFKLQSSVFVTKGLIVSHFEKPFSSTVPGSDKFQIKVIAPVACGCIKSIYIS
jgi:hypothetical protein